MPALNRGQKIMKLIVLNSQTKQRKMTDWQREREQATHLRAGEDAIETSVSQTVFPLCSTDCSQEFVTKNKIKMSSKNE
jgi:hypothetical protein